VTRSRNGTDRLAAPTLLWHASLAGIVRRVSVRAGATRTQTADLVLGFVETPSMIVFFLLPDMACYLLGVSKDGITARPTARNREVLRSDRSRPGRRSRVPAPLQPDHPPSTDCSTGEQ
jgi:hypothetical protein